jgi:glutathione S-transferase
MLTLYSYPELFGVADNNGYGLKVFAFLKLTGVPFVHQHLFDASAAPRGQLPYIVDDGDVIGDSETILAHLTRKYRLTIDAELSPSQRTTNHLVTRMLDDLYWVMSYSRWKDDRYFPAFRDGFMAQHAQIDEAGLNKARDYNAQRYYYQGIGRYTPDQAYARGVADLQVLADLIPADGYVHGTKPTSIDAGIYGFIANITFPPIDTPLKAFVSDHRNLVRHCEAVHAMVSK